MEFVALNASSSVLNIAGALVSHTSDSVHADDQHRADFVAKRLGISFAALACVPFALAYHGAPTAPEILAFASSLTPLAAAMIAARTGRLVVAHAITILGLTCLSLTLWLGLGCGAVCAMTWLLAAHAEAKSAADRRLSWLVGGITLVILAAALIMPEARLVPTQGTSTCVLVAGFALLYAWIIHADWWRADRDAPLQDEDTPTWRAMADAMCDTVLVFDRAGSVVRTRMGADDHLGMPSHHLMGRGFFEHVGIADRPAFLSMLSRAAQDDATAVSTIRLRTGGGSSSEVELRARRLARNGNTATPSHIVVLLRKTEAQDGVPVEIATMNQAADKIMPSKPEITANMGHALRTPLNAIIGFSEILASRTLRPTEIAKQQDYARIINESGHHLLSVVNAILATTKAGAALPPIDMAEDVIASLPEQRMMQVA